MKNKINNAFRYWFGAILKPKQVFEQFAVDAEKLSISLWILTLFALLYSLTSILLYRAGILPAFEPWMPIAVEQYYFYQTFWTIPWGLATGMMLAGTAHVIAVLGREDKTYTFEGALAVVTIAWVIPSFVLMWLPETVISLFFEGVPWPGWVEIMRLAILAPIWQVVLTVIGVRQTHRAGWWRSIIIGLVTTGASFLMFLPFMR
jgi:hypothetical protein